MCAHACMRVRVAHFQHRFRNLFSQADETGETVNGMPLKMFLDNGCPLEYLRLDSQVDETAKVSSHPSHHAPASLLLSMPSSARPNRPCCCRQMTLVRTYGVRQDFPRDLCPLTLRQIQFTMFNELCILYRVRASARACTTLHVPYSLQVPSCMPRNGRRASARVSALNRSRLAKLDAVWLSGRQDEWIDHSPGRTFEDLLLRWDKGTLFEVRVAGCGVFNLCCRDLRCGVSPCFALVFCIPGA